MMAAMHLTAILLDPLFDALEQTAVAGAWPILPVFHPFRVLENFGPSVRHVAYTLLVRVLHFLINRRRCVWKKDYVNFVAMVAVQIATEECSVETVQILGLQNLLLCSLKMFLFCQDTDTRMQ